MDHKRPEGCQAAVSQNWEHTSYGSKVTARLVCGDRNNVCESSFTREYFNLNHSVKVERATIDIKEKVTDALGAMCLGCPHNVGVAEDPVQ